MTALETAIKLAEQYLAEGMAIAKRNAESCVRFLQAAQFALRGLEDEVDQILIEAKVVAGFEWKRRPQLLKRIDDYLNRYRLAPVLGEAVKRIGECYEFARRDEASFFLRRREQKSAAMDDVIDLLGQLRGYLNDLAGSMAYSRENYAGPSGIDMPVLLELERLLKGGEESDPDKTGQIIIGVIDEHQRTRRRKGLQHATAASAVIQKLLNAFGVAVPESVKTPRRNE
jgi:hypothetical protein